MEEEVFDANYQTLVVGDKVVLLHTDSSIDLDKWYDSVEDAVVEITKVDGEKRLLWVKNCKYEIPMLDTLRMNDSD